MNRVIPNLVSIIIPVFNRKEMLREAVASVEAQSHRPIEIIIVDDGSTDGTSGECDRLTLHKDVVRAIHRENGGPGAARESGRSIARGEFIQYLDSDDLLLPGKLERQVDALRSHEEAGVAYGYTRLRRADGTVCPDPWKGSAVARDAMFPSFLAERWWDTPNPLYRRRVTDGAGPWLALWQEEDWEYDARIASLGTRLVHVPDYVVEVRQTLEGGLSGRWRADRRLLKSRCRAHEAIYSHASRAGIGRHQPEMRRFLREMFLVARQAGAAGLVEESRSLFELARRASGPEEGRGFGAYRAVASVLGWKMAGAAACWLDRVRPRSGGTA